MRLLVTGGAGYIGSTTAARLLDDGHDVVVVDDLRSGHRELVPAGAQFVQADVGEPSTYRHVLAGVDACLHFAASAEAGISMQRPDAFYANNTAATLRLLHALLDAGTRRFILSSTCAVYGQPDRLPVDEDTSTNPASPYGHSKLLIEQALPWLAQLKGLRYASLRYFNAAGATEQRGEDHPAETHVIPIVLEAAAGRRPGVEVFGIDYDTPDGTCVRDYVHVADLADAHAAALGALDTHERIVCNLGTGTGFSVRQIIETARQITGGPIPATISARRPGDPAMLYASAARAHDLLGWQPRHTTLEDIIATAWRWHQQRWGLTEAVA